MAITLRDVLKLDIMKDFKVIVGENNLNHIIKRTEILDFEFLEEGEEYRSDSFIGESIVLTSLLFAKDRPEQILRTIKKLMDFNVYVMAYKPVIFTSLPREALEYAAANDFVILEFGNDEFFEEIIYGVNQLNILDKSVGLAEDLISEMIRRDFSEEEAREAHEKINPFLRPQVLAICGRLPKWDKNRLYDVIKAGKTNDRIQSKVFMGKYKDMFMLVVSQDTEDKARFKALIEDVEVAYGIPRGEAIIGLSRIRHIDNHFDKIIKEAYWAHRVAEIEKANIMLYSNLGIYRVIIPHISSKDTLEFMKEFLSPLFYDEDLEKVKEPELLKTAIAYILSKGEINQTAETLFCHRNTIRYRIGKLQEKLFPMSLEKEFYENLSAAVKIYLLTKNEEPF